MLIRTENDLRTLARKLHAAAHSVTGSPAEANELAQAAIDQADIYIRSGWEIRSQYNKQPAAEWRIEYARAGIVLQGKFNNAGEAVAPLLFVNSLPVAITADDYPTFQYLVRRIV